MDRRNCGNSERNRELGENSVGELTVSLLGVCSYVESENEDVTAEWKQPACYWRSSILELGFVSRTRRVMGMAVWDTSAESPRPLSGCWWEVDALQNLPCFLSLWFGSHRRKNSEQFAVRKTRTDLEETCSGCNLQPRFLESS